MKHIEIPSINPDLAYLCGVFAGDGSINFRKNKNEYLLKCVGNPNDEKDFYLNVVGPKFKNIFGFIPNIKYCDGGTTFGFIVYSKELVNYLTQNICLPLGKKYDSLIIPKIFLKDKKLTINFIRGVFDTDGCISFKKRYRSYPYYPVISLSSKSQHFIQENAKLLKSYGFKVVEIYNYKIKDKRILNGFTIINRIELNGRENFKLWLQEIDFFSPKHLDKIDRYWKESSGRRI